MTMIMNAKSFAMRLVQVITDRICPIPIRYLFKRWQMLFLRKFSVMHNGTYKYRHRWWWNYGVNNRILFTTTNKRTTFTLRCEINGSEQSSWWENSHREKRWFYD